VAQRKKQICDGMGVRKTRLLNAIPRGKFGLSAGIQTDIPPGYDDANFMQNLIREEKYYFT
jgi:hypothetical protein